MDEIIRLIANILGLVGFVISVLNMNMISDLIDDLKRLDLERRLLTREYEYFKKEIEYIRYKENI